MPVEIEAKKVEQIRRLIIHTNLFAVHRYPATRKVPKTCVVSPIVDETNFTKLLRDRFRPPLSADLFARVEVGTPRNLLYPPFEHFATNARLSKCQQPRRVEFSKQTAEF